MVQRCCLISCRRGPAPDRTLFRFPLDRAKRLTWFEAVNSDLPENLTVDSLNNKYICDAHFAPVMYATSGNRKRLFCNACPFKMAPRPPKIQMQMQMQIQMPENVITDENKHSVATQVHFAHNEREIISLKKKIASLVAKMEKLKSDPPASLIYKNRHKLAQYVTDEAWLLFDCAATNQRRGHHGHRHTMDVKKFTQVIAQKNRSAFKILKPIFALPSLRTLGRMETETTNNTSNQITENNSDEDKSQREESTSVENIPMDQTSHQENNTTIEETLHLANNITFEGVSFH